jgi:hypothetical protein
MTRILGPTGSGRRRRTLLGGLVSFLLLSLMILPSAFAVHDDGFFELGPTPTAPEANITNILGNTTDPGPDWADLFDANGAPIDSDNDGTPDFQEVFGGRAAAFIADPSSAAGALDPTTFSGAGTSNKNNDPISGPETVPGTDCEVRGLSGSACNPWHWDAGNVPAKDDITNVYAYEVVPSSGPLAGHLLLYVGFEREDPSGSSHVDIEFLQSQVAMSEDPPCNDPGSDPTPCTFTGIRTVGDVILSMEFLNGGAFGSANVREWTGTEYELKASAGGQGCFDAGPPPPESPPDDVCAFTNGANIDGGPWPNLDNHGKVINVLQTNAFTEVGADLGEIIGITPCFSTFMGKTRSSASFTAELKDFALQNFEICQPSTILTAEATATAIHAGDSVTITFSETNDGNEELLNATVTADNGCTPAGVDADNDGFNDGDVNADAELDPGETWLFSCTVSPTADVTITGIGSAVGKDSGLPVTFPGDPEEQASVSITVINPSTSLRETAQVTIVYTFREENTGDDPLTGVAVTSDIAGCSPTLQSGDTDSDNVLDTDETWVFTCTVTTTDGEDLNQTNTGTGTGTDSLGDPVPETDEEDSVTVTVTHHPPPAP